jgi:hypothetical protein
MTTGWEITRLSITTGAGLGINTRFVTGATTGVSMSLTDEAVDGTNNGLGATTLLVIVRVSTTFGTVEELNLLYSTTPGCKIGATPSVVLLIS